MQSPDELTPSAAVVRRERGTTSGVAAVPSPATIPSAAMAGAPVAGISHSQSSEACASQYAATSAAPAATIPPPGRRIVRNAPANAATKNPPSRSAPTRPVWPSVRHSMLCGYISSS